MPPKRKPRRRRTLTGEELAALRERNEQLLERADEALHDPDEVADQIRTGLASGYSGRLLRYSLRNQILLAQQAEERGIDLRDVDTAAGWRRRGRHIRLGERALYIVRPAGDPDDGKSDASGASGGESDAATGESGDGAEGARRPRFRMAPRWDISQTGALPHIGTEDREVPAACVHCGADADQPCTPECECEYCDAARAEETTADPGEIVWNSLVTQTEREGYTFDWPADPQHLGGSIAAADHTARVLRVARRASAADPDALAAIATALAEILTRPRSGPAAPSMPPALPSSVSEF